MKILFAPNNIASMPAITAAALNKIPSVEAKYISTKSHKYVQENDARIDLDYGLNTTALNPKSIRFNFLNLLNLLFVKPFKLFTLCKYIIWADVVHWTWDNTMKNNFDLWLIKFLHKKRFIEWVGSEMRVPEITMEGSKWYKEIYDKGYEYRAIENKERSYALQKKFAKYGFTPILIPEMQLFLKPGLFNKVFPIQNRIFEREKYPEPFFPQPHTGKVIIVHSPSALYAKGSYYIIPLMEKLTKQFAIEFILLHNVSRQEVLDTVKRCDIFIDQIILGSYAAAAIEAMSLGKPVMAYIMPQVYKHGTPPDCPIINVNPDTLEEKLVEYILNPELRYNTGVRSRKFVEEIHNADNLAYDLLEIYRSSIT